MRFPQTESAELAVWTHLGPASPCGILHCMFGLHEYQAGLRFQPVPVSLFEEDQQGARVSYYGPEYLTLSPLSNVDNRGKSRVGKFERKAIS